MNIWTIVLLIVLGFAGYLLFGKSSNSDDDTEEEVEE